jgi:hypothetical protein
MTAEEFDRRMEAGTPVNIAPGRPTLVVETPFMRASVTNTEPLWTSHTSSKTTSTNNPETSGPPRTPERDGPDTELAGDAPTSG